MSGFLGSGAGMAADGIRRFHEAEHKKKLELIRAGKPGGGISTGEKQPRALGAGHQAHINRTRGSGVITPLRNNVPPTSSTLGKRKRKRKRDDRDGNF